MWVLCASGIHKLNRFAFCFPSCQAFFLGDYKQFRLGSLMILVLETGIQSVKVLLFPSCRPREVSFKVACSPPSHSLLS